MIKLSIIRNRKDKYEHCYICHMPIRKIKEENLPVGVQVYDKIICSNCLSDGQDLLPYAQEEFELIQPKKEIEEEVETKVPTFKEMVEDINKVVKGQEKQIEKLCATIIRNSQNIATNKVSRKNNHIIIIGDSGTGKTLMLNQLSKITNKICSYEDATSYTEEGYVGDSIKDMLHNLLIKADYDLEVAQNGIIVIDEGDKKVSDNPNTRDISGKQVLFSMLKMLDGAKIPINIKGTANSIQSKIIFDTSKLTFVYIGVFEGLNDIINKRTSTKRIIGFSYNEQKKEENFNKAVLARDLIDLGFPKEFIGRFPVIIRMNPMTKEIIKEILLSESSYLNEEIRKLEDKGAIIDFSDNIIDEISEYVTKTSNENNNINTGARAVEPVINYIFEDIWYKILEKDDNEICTFKLLEGITRDNLKYEILN